MRYLPPSLCIRQPANVDNSEQEKYFADALENTKEWKEKIVVVRNFTSDAAKLVPDVMVRQMMEVFGLPFGPCLPFPTYCMHLLAIAVVIASSCHVFKNGHLPY